MKTMVRVEINMGTKDVPEWKEMWLSDRSLKMYCVSPLFDKDNSGGTFSQIIDVDVRMNEHIFGNSAEVHGESLYAMIDGRQARMSVAGIPFFFGKFELEDEVQVKDGKVSMTLCADGKDWKALIKDKKLRELDLLKERIVLGYCMNDDIEGYVRMRSTVYTNMRMGIVGSGTRTWVYDDSYYDVPHEAGQADDGWYQRSFAGMTLPKVVWNKSYGDMIETNHINTTYEYDPIRPNAHPFCNIRTCFQKYSFDEDKEQWEQERGYTVHEPDEMNSAPCFYVLYVLDLILKALGVRKESSSLDKEIDMRRLAIVHSNCAYAYKDIDGRPFSDPIPRYDQSGKDKFEYGGFEAKIEYDTGRQYNSIFGDGNGVFFRNKDGVLCYRVTDIDKNVRFGDMKLYFAYATSENLPDISFEDFIAGLENGFGVRFLYDSERGNLKIVKIQDVLTDTEVKHYACTIVKEEKLEKKIRGFELGYSAAKGIETNSLTGEKKMSQGNDDTVYQYNDYRNVVVMNPDVPNPAVPRNFKELVYLVNDRNMNLYYNPVTGDMTRVKVDKDAKTPSEWFPSLMEVNQFRSVRIGDCSNSDYVHKIDIGFSPMMSNIVNVREICNEASAESTSENVGLKYAMFCDGEVHVKENELVKQSYQYNAMSLGSMVNSDGNTVAMAHVDVKLTVESKFGYDVNGSDPFFDGNAEFVLGVMRGSGSDARVQRVLMNYDEQGSNLCTRVAGSDAECTADSVNAMGEVYDYNGSGVIDTREAASAAILSTFASSNANLLSAKRRVTAAQMKEKYPGFSDGWATVYSQSWNIRGKEYLMTPISDDGHVYSESEMRDYVDTLSGFMNIMSGDKSSPVARRLIIGVYGSVEEANQHGQFLHELHAIYYAMDGEEIEPVLVPNGLGYESVRDLISLKIKAEKTVNGGEDAFADAAPNSAYYPMKGELARRGIFDRYYWALAWLMLNGKWVKKRLKMEIGEVRSIELLKMAKIGETVGWIVKYEWELDMESGLCDVEMEMVYLG